MLVTIMRPGLEFPLNKYDEKWITFHIDSGFLKHSLIENIL